MTFSGSPSSAAPDAVARSWVERAPAGLQPYLRLARYDRPIGFWLLAIPCWIGLALARLDGAWRLGDAALVVLFGLGAVAMRGAGCTWNDLLDRDLDAKVARTANRPLASGALAIKAALGFLAAQLAVGLVVLLLLPRPAQITALCAIPLVALYPLMKRITWFPQAWLGLTFNWGALVGYAAAMDAIWPPAVLVFLGLAAWTFGYDTIYAGQDVEDDALVGVKSTARLFGAGARLGSAIAYLVGVVLIAIGATIAALQTSFQSGDGLREAAFVAVGLGIAGFAIHLGLQIARVRFDDVGACLSVFRSNRTAGLILAASLASAALWRGLFV